MKKELRDELERLANDGTAADMQTNGRLALLALLVTVEKQEEVIEAARALMTDTMDRPGSESWRLANAMRDALIAYDAMTEDEEAYWS